MHQSGERIFQANVRGEINMPLKEVWDFILSKHGLDIWLGTWKLDKWETGINFTTDKGIKGEVRVFNPYSHIRLSWQPKNWENNTILEIKTVSHNEKTIIHLHHEQLTEVSQKEQMESHWKKVLSELITAIKTI